MIGVVLLVTVMAAAPLVLVLRGGISARSEPNSAEEMVARRRRRHHHTAEARAARNPLTLEPRILAEGRAHFADHCASCHANDGSGRTDLGRNLYPRAPDMRRPTTQELTDGELFYVIENGVRLTGMPGWGGAGRPEESWKLVHFIRHLPRLTPGEQAEMEQLNPRSAEEWRELQEETEFLKGTGRAPSPRHNAGH
jgi:mono/diheme cytochrome c family protein